MCGSCLLVRVVQVHFLLMITAHVLTAFRCSLTYLNATLRLLRCLRLLGSRRLRCFGWCLLYRYLATHQDGYRLVVYLVYHRIKQVDRFQFVDK